MAHTAVIIFAIAASVCCVCCIIASIPAIIVGTLYGVENDRNYQKTNCTILSTGYETHRCSQQHCSGTTSTRHCTTTYYTCCSRWWRVEYNINGRNRTNKIETANNSDYCSTSGRGPGYVDTCYYYSGDVRWEKPDVKGYFIGTMVCVAVGAVALLCAIGLGLTSAVVGAVGSVCPV